MSNWRVGFAAVMCLLTFVGCRGKSSGDQPIAGPPTAGGLYSFNDGEGGFRAGKVIAVEEAAIFVLLYSERWTERPSRARAQTLSDPIAVAYSSQTVSGMQPVLLESGEVNAEELARYEAWKEQSSRDLF